jgi:NADH-quinone oxidoreductase subunit M
MTICVLLLILLTGAVATFIAGDKWASKVALFFSLSSLATAIFLLQKFNQGDSCNYFYKWIASPNINLALIVDGLSIAMVLLTTSLLPIIIFSSFENKFVNSKNIYSLILFMAFAMVGVFTATDGLLYYIFWELALLPIYFIALVWGNGSGESRKKAVVKFFIYTLAGSLFMLVGLVYLYQKAGSFLLNDLYQVKLSSNEQTWIFLAFFMAYAIKIPMIPFHTWQAKVYQKSPTVGTMLLSGIMLKMGLYSIIRWQLPITPQAAKSFMPVLLVLGITGVVYGSVIALQQKNLKRLLAYSSLAHVGLIAAGCYTLNINGITAAVLQMIAHGFVVVGLFLIAEIIYRRYATFKISKMGGIRTQANKLSSFFLILVMASVGLPLTFNFVGEFMVLYSLSQIGIGYAIAGGTTLILGAYYMLKMFQNVMLGSRNVKAFKDISVNESLSLLVIVTVLLFFGFFPKPIYDLISPSLELIIQQINKN